MRVDLLAVLTCVPMVLLWHGCGSGSGQSDKSQLRSLVDGAAAIQGSWDSGITVWPRASVKEGVRKDHAIHKIASYVRTDESATHLLWHGVRARDFWAIVLAHITDRDLVIYTYDQPEVRDARVFALLDDIQGKSRAANETRKKEFER